MRRCGLVLLALVCSCYLVSCGGSKLAARSLQVLAAPAPSADSTPQRLEDARAELAALACPADCDPAAFEELRASLDALLQARADGKVPAKLPAAQRGAVADLRITSGSGSFEVEWTYKNQGDYDLNGEVNGADIAPIAKYFRAGTQSANWSTAQAADGDANGEVNGADIVPIAASFFSQVLGYNVYGGDSDEGPWTLVEAVPLSAASAGFPLEFSYSLGAAPGYDWYALAPYDATGTDELGTGAANHGALVDLDEDVLLVEQTMGAGGGTIAGPAGSPIEGVVLEVPAGAFEVDTQVSLGYNDGTVTFEHGSQLGQIIEIETDYGQAFVKPLSITVPVGTDPATLPIPYYINSGGELELCQMTSLDQTAGTMTFETWHASAFVVNEARMDNPLAESYDTGFDPAKDGFQIGASYSEERALDKIAMLCFAEWYYRTGSTQKGRLYGNFMEPIDDYSGQFIISVRALNSLIAAYSPANKDMLEQSLALTPQQRWLKLRSAMRHGPQVAILKPAADYPRVVLVFAYVGNDVFFYDPRIPGATNEANYDPVTHEVKTGDHILQGFFATGSLPTHEPFSNICQDALKNFDNTSYAEIFIESHQQRQVVNESKPTVSGRVESGTELVDELWFINRTNSLKPPAIAQVALDGKFEIELPLQAGENWFELVTRKEISGGKHLVVENTSDYIEGFMLESTVQGGNVSEEPLLISIRRTTHLSDSLEDANMTIFVHVYGPDGSAIEGISEGKVYQEPDGTPYLYAVPNHLTTWAVSEGQYEYPWDTTWDGFGQQYSVRANFTRNWGPNMDMGYEIKVYKNLIGEHPGYVELRGDPDSFEWEGVESFSGTIAEPDGPPWEALDTGPGWSGYHTFTPTEPLQ